MPRCFPFSALAIFPGTIRLVRVVVEDLSFNTTGPFSRTNNEHSIFDRADLVMIDPVGTGFSRAVRDAK
ncbi:MAG: carboxypeptidase C (cathepsin A) [Arenicella sp.]